MTKPKPLLRLVPKSPVLPARKQATIPQQLLDVAFQIRTSAVAVAAREKQKGGQTT